MTDDRDIRPRLAGSDVLLLGLILLFGLLAGAAATAAYVGLTAGVCS